IRILVVDEEAESRLSLTRMVAELGAEVEPVPDRTKVASLWRASRQSGRPCRLVICAADNDADDLPACAERLRLELAQPELPMILIGSGSAAGAWSGTPRLASLSRPVKREALWETIRTLLTPPVEPRQTTTAESAPTAGLDILVVDDSEDNILLVKAFLKKTPHRLSVAHNGEEAVERVTQSGARFDLILMDVQMPVMDGYSATRAIRSWEATHGHPPVPVIALTAHAFAENERQTLEAGCSEHLTKPITKPRLLVAIDRYLPRS
ncbi:MAG: response regulator, partial [Magnetococcales bacterium]|nr:response regulator [Magnetococcales bacterium]